jgi:branched-chain amino acid transport system permease protein
MEFYLPEFLQYLLNGITQGAIYALIALGYTMVYGILQLINFAHGEFYMVGAFLGLFFIAKFPPIIAIPMAMLCCGLLAVTVERIAYRPLRGAGRIAPLITALGVSIFLLEFMRVVEGPKPQAFPQFFENVTYTLYEADGSKFAWMNGIIVLQKTHIVIMMASLSIMSGLWYIVMKTRMGRAMRALSMDFDASRLMGVNINAVIAFTFFLGAALAAAAGILVGMHFNNVEPMMGQLAGLKAFTSAVLGGIGVIPGAALGGLVLGVCENLVTGYLPSSYRDAIAFGVLILVLMIRPWGILGKPERVKV